MVLIIKYIFWFFVSYYLLKILIRLLAPILLRRFASKMQDRFRQQFNEHRSYSNQSSTADKEGKVTIDKNIDPNKKKSNNIGEYVDFEEIDD